MIVTRTLLMAVLMASGLYCRNLDAGDAIAEALTAPDRTAEDRASDSSRHPDKVLAFFGMTPGMTVLDLFSGGGYYTEIASRVVGERGEVLAHNNQAYLDYARESIEGRYVAGRLDNVRQLVAEANQLNLPGQSFDMALIMLTWHDFYYVDSANGWPEIDATAMVSRLCSALKPDGILGLTDHVAMAGSDPAQTAQQLHRIDPAQITADLEAGCFRFVGEIDVLRNPDDDLTQPMYAQGIRGNTDRVVYKFRKVASE